MSHLADLLASLPSTSGVYCMKDRSGKIIYVGKSVSLKSRVNSYWNDRKNLNFAKQSMIWQVRDLEIFETRNELEALVLETNLIKQWKPKYNILMKDDKNLAYIRITSGAVPEVVKARNKLIPGEYFGPYTAGANVTEILKILKRIFHIRSCRVEFIEEPVFSPYDRGSQRGYTDAQVPLPTSPILGEEQTILSTTRLRLGNKAGRSIPCIDHYIGLCPAPCLLQDDKIAKYRENIDRIRSFLSGKSAGVIEEMRAKMMEKAKSLEFEEAGKIKLQIEQIEKLGTKQIVRDSVSGDHDVVVMLEKYGKIFFSTTEIRAGEMTGIYSSEADNRLEESTEEVMEAFLVRRYFDEENPPPKGLGLLLNREPGDTIRSWLRSKHIGIELPLAGAKKELLNFAEYNLTNFAYREEMKELAAKTLSRGTMLSILERLGYGDQGINNPIPPTPLSQGGNNPTLPESLLVIPAQAGISSRSAQDWLNNSTSTPSETHEISDQVRDDGKKWGKKQKEIVFECYDISHTAGQFTVASRSVIVNGKPDSNRYRKYKIKTLEKGQIDDFASLREVLSRRTLEGMEEGNWPDMIIIDGGKGQLSSVVSAMSEAISTFSPYDRGSQRGYTDAQVPLPASPILGEEPHSITHKTPYLCSLAKREEEVFVPGKSEPVLFEKGTPELMLFQKIRDEAHRFAITFNRSARTKAMKKNILEELPGFGPVTRKKLLKLAGNVDGIKDISAEELKSILTAPQIETLRDHGIIDI